ncbi:MAG: hypothetical protein BBJ57_08540 [Desulfobacterales bacterium PC51MH44]|nr:MAG: hypothetical protein BBJ57_08540 [Desulfobacterales bacterium PC51MH44]
MLSKLSNFLSVKLLNSVIIIMFVIMSGAVFIQVVFRYVLHQPIYWSEEVPRFMLIWLTFLGSVLAMKNRSHLSITLLINRFPKRTRLWIQCFANIMALLFLLVMVWGGVVITNLTMPNRSAALQLPTGLVYLAVPVGGILMIIYLARQTLDLFRGKTDKDETGELKE